MELCAECPVAAIYLRDNLWLIKAKCKGVCLCTYDDLHRVVSVWFYYFFLSEKSTRHCFFIA